MGALFRPSPKKRFLGLIGWLMASFVAGGIGVLASTHSKVFYELLSRPEWAPPAWLFGPVWSVLYILMAMAAWLVWCQYGFSGARRALSLYVVQLAFNAVWTWLFFGMRSGTLALTDIILLWMLLGATVLAFWRLHRLAALLLLPYFAWVSFALALTFSLWHMNPVLLR